MAFMTSRTHRKTEIDIGIPALNEDANIQQLLRSIVEQPQDTYEIANIFLVSDGSTDNTVMLCWHVV
jgi:glycosyltransferase involved in cell wall biosynthesis